MLFGLWSKSLEELPHRELDPPMAATWRGEEWRSTHGQLHSLSMMDGATVVHEPTDRFLTVRTQLVTGGDCPYYCEGRGTRHNTAASIAYLQGGVWITKSETGAVYLFSEPHVKDGECICLREGQKSVGGGSIELKQLMSRVSALEDTVAQLRSELAIFKPAVH